jgi:cobalt/nickel transport system permease protein
MLPIWYKASRAVGTIVKSRYVPLLAIGASFSFLVMMFNIPVPDGTTAHAVGATIIAIILGPWAAVIAVSIALVIQALFFGYGGVLAIAVNCFNMAFVPPFVGYYVYRASRVTHPDRRPPGGRRQHRRLRGHQRGGAVHRDRAQHPARPVPRPPACRCTPVPPRPDDPAMLFAHLTVAGFAESRRRPASSRTPAREPADQRSTTRTCRRATRAAEAAGVALGAHRLAVSRPHADRVARPGGAFGEDAP